jgi:hypothetical protein
MLRLFYCPILSGSDRSVLSLQGLFRTRFETFPTALKVSCVRIFECAAGVTPTVRLRDTQLSAINLITESLSANDDMHVPSSGLSSRRPAIPPLRFAGHRYMRSLRRDCDAAVSVECQ